MGWQAVVVLNFVIAGCYVVIAGLIAQGLIRTRQLLLNPLALTTVAIFTTSAFHHAHDSVKLLVGGGAEELSVVRAMFGDWHGVLIDASAALVTVTYLGLRHSYKALLNTPAMFEDAVRVASERQLRARAFTDELTGIPNRAAYQQFSDSLAETPLPVAVFFIDLDGFKAVNDTYGHDAGDRLLRDVAQRIQAGLATERIFRIGGDEFAVVAPDVKEDGSPDLLPLLTSMITQPISLRGTEIVIGASIGVARGVASGGTDHLLREADADMYRIKARLHDELQRQKGREEVIVLAAADSRCHACGVAS